MDRITLRTNIVDNGEHLCLQMENDQGPLGHILLSAPELEQFIEQLMEQRARLSEQVAEDLDHNTRLKALLDPIWRTSPDNSQGRVLALRHPGLGWTAFVFPPAEAERIAGYLKSGKLD